MSEQATIKVTTVSTRGEKQVIEMAPMAEWSTLKKILEQKGFSTSGVKFVESTQKHTLEAPNAILPSTDFFLFIMPLRNKSGAAEPKTSAREKVKALFAEDREHAKAHFGNYTQVKEPVLVELLKTYKKRTAAEKKAATPEKGKKVTATKTKAVATAKAIPPATAPIDPDVELRKLAATLPDVRL